VLECETKGKSDAETGRSDSPRMVVFRSARLKGRCEDGHGSETYLNNNKAATRLIRQVTAAAHPASVACQTVVNNWKVGCMVT
jgi:hypothetical protein